MLIRHDSMNVSKYQESILMMLKKWDVVLGKKTRPKFNKIKFVSTQSLLNQYSRQQRSTGTDFSYPPVPAIPAYFQKLEFLEFFDYRYPRVPDFKKSGSRLRGSRSNRSWPTDIGDADLGDGSF